MFMLQNAKIVNHAKTLLKSIAVGLPNQELLIQLSTNHGGAWRAFSQSRSSMAGKRGDQIMIAPLGPCHWVRGYRKNKNSSFCNKPALNHH